jgi:nucleoid DNA-binding protein
MKKPELFNYVSYHSKVPAYKVKKVLRYLVAALQTEMARRGAVTMWGIGTIESKWSATRSGVDFNGDEIMIPGHFRIAFTPSRTFRKAARAGEDSLRSKKIF